MQKENEREKDLRLSRRSYLRELDAKLNAEKPEPKKEEKPKKKKEAKIEPVEETKEEVFSIDEGSNEDSFFSPEEE